MTGSHMEQSVREYFERARPRGIVSAYLFGSHARDAAHRESDMEVAVLNDAPPELAAGVVSRGRRLYCVDSAADQAFARTALLRHADIRPFLDRTRALKLRALAR